jgi:hypothetical protein
MNSDFLRHGTVLDGNWCEARRLVNNDRTRVKDNGQRSFPQRDAGCRCDVVLSPRAPDEVRRGHSTTDIALQRLSFPRGTASA